MPETEWTKDLMPFDADAEDQAPEMMIRAFAAVAQKPFAYIGRGLTLDEFRTYVETFDFGKIPPDFVVLHHTAIPSTIHARYPTGAVWDEGEIGMTKDEILQKRLLQLGAIMRFYRDTHGWTAGPHLFIDDLFIYLFTPMNQVGIHAKSGNSYQAGGKLHYSVGIEMIGYYEKVKWSESVERLAGGAVAILQQRLRTFDIRFSRGAGGISSHRDWGKPQCPGAAITNLYYLRVLQDALARERQAHSAVLTNSMTVNGQGQAYACPQLLAEFYEECGGLRTFGFPLRDAEIMTDSQGERCSYLKVEHGYLKLKPSQGAWAARMAPINEVVSLEQRGRPN